jgi:anti-anti-sigma regulatory factor
LVVESALITYVETAAGRTLVNQLQYRKKDGQNVTPTNRQDNVENVLHKLKGDFD